MNKKDTPDYLTKTERLVLRPMQKADADVVYQYRNHPEISRFQGWAPQGPEEVSDYAEEMMSREFAQPGFWYQVILQLNKDDLTEDLIIGDMAFCIEAELRKQAELGIALDVTFQKQGLAQEAVKGLVTYLFNTFDLHRIHVSIDPENHASRKLFSRAGFREEGHLKQSVFFKGQWTDDIIMAVLKEEWHQ